MSFFVVISALLLDQTFGEPRRFHPLVGFGRCADWLEQRLNTQSSVSPPINKEGMIKGLISLLLLTLPCTLIILILSQTMGKYAWALDIATLYWAIGLRSLQQHISPIQSALNANNISESRYHLSRIVSRDTGQLDAQQITVASIETTLENGNDTLFGALFWYLIGGPPLLIFYRLVNTLDAMWGYRNKRYEYFGKTTAKLDDLVNYLPARLTAFSYSLCAILDNHFKQALNSWRKQAPLLASPNAGPVMAAGAGSLNVQLGGPTYYHQQLSNKPYFGGSEPPKIPDIQRAMTLVVRSTVLWCAVIGIITLL